MPTKKRAKRATREELPGIVKKALDAAVEVLEDEGKRVAQSSRRQAETIIDSTIIATQVMLQAGLERLAKLKQKRDRAKRPDGQ